MKVIKQTAELYRIRKETPDEGFTWGDVVLIFGEHSVEVLANSDYGHFAYYWSHTGPNPKQFLTDVRMDYAMEKLSSHNMTEPDPEAREIEVKAAIIRARKNGRLDKKQARESWDDLTADMNDFGVGEAFQCILYNHARFVEIFGDTDGLPGATRVRPNCREFWNRIWLPLVEQLKHELAVGIAA